MSLPSITGELPHRNGHARLVTSLAVLLCLAPLPALGQTPGSLDERIVEIADANAATNDLIVSANVHATVTLLKVDPNSEPFHRNYRELHWTKKGPRERLEVRRTIPGVAPAKVAPDHKPALNTSIFLQIDHRQRTYRNYERRIASVASGARPDAGSIDSAYEAELSGWRPAFEYHSDFCLQFSLHGYDDTRTLKQIVAEWPATYGGTAEVDGVNCEVIRAMHPPLPPSGETPVEFFVDRNAGAMIRRIVVHQPTGQLVKTVTKYHRVSNGATLPLECDSVFWPSDPSRKSQATMTRVQVTSFSINEEVADGEVRIPFPVGTEVRIYDGPLRPRESPKQSHWGLVGEDGEITQRFKADSEDWLQYKTNHK